MLKAKIMAAHPGAEPAPAPAEPPIDLSHLLRMTLGDHRLAREVLQLFDRQVELLISRIRQVERSGIAALAHTLKGSARGIGAWRVAHAAEAIELAVAASDPIEDALVQLEVAAAEARQAVAEMSRLDNWPEAGVGQHP